jgi:hypothetical protein
MHSLFGKVYFESEKEIEFVKKDFEVMLGSEARNIEDDDFGDREFTFRTIGKTKFSIIQAIDHDISEFYIYEFNVNYHRRTLASDFIIDNYLHTLLRNSGYKNLISPKIIPSRIIKEEEYIIEAELIINDSRPTSEIIANLKEVFNSASQNNESGVIARQFGCEFSIEAMKDAQHKYLFSVKPILNLKTVPQRMVLDAYFEDVLKENNFLVELFR